MKSRAGGPVEDEAAWIGWGEGLEGRGARARLRTKAGLGFEATIAPNTTSSLADVGRNLDWAREGGGDILKASLY
eukprot:scaffold75439_cov35-Phaeocystis_antarctica.AAC.2